MIVPFLITTQHSGYYYSVISFIFCKYLHLYIENTLTNTNRHIQTHKCLYYARIELTTSGVVPNFSRTAPNRSTKYILGQKAEAQEPRPVLTKCNNDKTISLPVISTIAQTYLNSNSYSFEKYSTIKKFHKLE